ncbi:sulfotransferase [Nocardioides sp. GCM10027113]|uniref:sulfotransferase n=1 Tax=unclassified Nocardioides TaxID=2615069 RepID=UPI00360B3D8E
MTEARPVGAQRNTSSLSRVCFIGATGRSGSTLVSRVLGSLPGAVSVGELCWIWTYGVMRNRACGCGAPFLECAFWSAVGEHAFGGWDRVDAERANDVRRRITRNRRIPELLGRPLGPSTGADVDDYVANLGRLYAGITAASDAQVIIDNSKQPEVALLARRTPGVDLRVLHLVRRSHGVAYSWTKHVLRSDAGREMLRKPPSRTAAAWLLDNAVFEAIGRTGTPRHQLRYEDFVAAPRERTREVAAFLGLDPSDAALPFRGPADAELATDHSVWGNPMRLQTGVVTIRPDDAWRESLPADERRTVTAISWPGLLRYGYGR